MKARVLLGSGLALLMAVVLAVVLSDTRDDQGAVEAPSGEFYEVDHDPALREIDPVIGDAGSTPDTFDTWDADGDGIVTRGEYDANFRSEESGAPTVSASQAPPTFASLDVNNDGSIESEEVFVWLTGSAAGDGPNRPFADSVLSRWDTDANGEISRAEFDSRQRFADTAAAGSAADPQSTETAVDAAGVDRP